MDREGLSYGPDSGNIYATATATAVAQYQSRNNITPTGFFGALTRRHLNLVYGCTAASTVSTQPSITVASPSGGENWTIGSTYTITWTSTGLSASDMMGMKLIVPIALAGGSGVYQYIITNGTPNSGSFTWTVPSTAPAGSGYYIQIWDYSTTAIGARLSNNFSLSVPNSTPSITVTSPNGGETWTQGQTYNITWTAPGFDSTAPLQIYLISSTGGYIWSRSVNAGDGTTSWTLPVNTIYAPPGQFRMRISHRGANGVEDMVDYSDSPFTIAVPAEPLLTVTSPNGGETWTQGQTYNITWAHSGFEGKNQAAVLYLYTAAGVYADWSVLVNLGSGSYAWTLPVGDYNNYAPPGQYKIKIGWRPGTWQEGYFQDTLTDMSDNAFTIALPATSTPPSISILQPNNSKTFTAGSTMTVGFSTTGLVGSTVQISLKDNSTGTLFPLAPFTVTYNGTQTIFNEAIPSTVLADSDYRVYINSGATTATSRSDLTIIAPTSILSVSRNSAYADQNANPNTSGVKIGSYIVQNQSTSESIRLTSLSIATTTATATINNFSALRTSDITGSGSTPIQFSGTGSGFTSTDVFSINDILPIGGSIVIDIFANTGAAATGTITTTLNVSSIGVVDNIPATSGATAGQTLTLGTGTMAATFIYALSTPPQNVPVGTSGANNATQATYNFISSGGSSTIQELKFTITGSDANPSNAITNTCVGSVCASPVNGIAYLTGLNIAVPNGGSGANQTAYVSYAGVGPSGIASGTTSSISLTYAKYQSGGTMRTIGTSVVCTATIGGACNTTLAVGGIAAFQMTLVSPSFPNTGTALKEQVKAITVDLQEGSTGNDVAILQQFLISQNKGPAAQSLAQVGATTYFGALTQAALAEFQANVGIYPALGNFGPVTRAYLDVQ